MIVGIPREVRPHETRVAITPNGIRELVSAGHEVLIQMGAGQGSAIPDAEFTRAGARIVPGASSLFSEAELIVKVKEPQPGEVELMRPGQTLFAYLHLAADPTLAGLLAQRDIRAISYETVRNPDGSLPLLAPMSEIAGRMAPHVGASLLERARGGRGMLIGGATGVQSARVLVLGAGVAGGSAARIAAGMEAAVAVLDRDLDKLRAMDRAWRGRIQTLYATTLAIEREAPVSDVVVGAALVPGARAPRLISAELVGEMRPGSVLIDIAIDQGGCFETSRATTHAHPTFVQHEVVHYCVSNMPGAVPHTSTYALTNATLPYVLELAGSGVDAAVRDNPSLAAGVNVWDGHVTNEGVASACQVPFVPLSLLGTRGDP